MDFDMQEPQLQGLEPVFQCNILQADHIPSEHHFHEFQVNIGPDLEEEVPGTSCASSEHHE